MCARTLPQGRDLATGARVIVMAGSVAPRLQGIESVDSDFEVISQRCHLDVSRCGLIIVFWALARSLLRRSRDQDHLEKISAEEVGRKSRFCFTPGLRSVRGRQAIERKPPEETAATWQPHHLYSSTAPGSCARLAYAQQLATSSPANCLCALRIMSAAKSSRATPALRPLNEFDAVDPDIAVLFQRPLSDANRH